MVVQNITGEKVDMAGEASGCIRTGIFPGTTDYSNANISFYEIVGATGMGYGRDGYPGCPIVSLYLNGEEVHRLVDINILLQEFRGDSAFLQFSGLRYSYNPANALLFAVPLVNLPIPTSRAVIRAEVYTGDGIQPVHSEGYVPLEHGDEKLYHVVTDAYLLLFFPMVKDILPHLEIVPKNADGEPVPPERFDELIVHHADGRELKVWEAVVSYAAAQLPGVDGIPQIPDYYEGVAGRINKTWTFPLVGWLFLILVVIVAGIVFLVFHRRKHKKAVT
jgi:hypothetical protein